MIKKINITFVFKIQGIKHDREEVNSRSDGLIQFDISKEDMSREIQRNDIRVIEITEAVR